jgi:exopolysaccharide/PEP-CTERM locus tyrosine autokinase
MSLIEEAAKRLEQLRQAGVEIPGESNADRVVATTPSSAAAPAPQASKPMAAAGEATSRVQAVESRTKPVTINLEALGAAGFITPQSSRSQIAEEFRVIKRPLIANAMGKGAAPIANGNLIMVTSAVPNEGKTFTAINLAMSIAMELDNTVMLVDADVAHPSVLNVLGLPPGPGLLDVLQKESLDLSGVMLKANIEKLTLLPAGTQHPRATELLASDAMVNLLHEMATRYSDRIIIFDSPPLLVTTEAHVLASHMGQIVMVTRAEHTLHNQVKQALATIDACPVKLMVLNRSRPDPLGTYGYGYGSYGYGYGHRQGSEM